MDESDFDKAATSLLAQMTGGSTPPEEDEQADQEEQSQDSGQDEELAVDEQDAAPADDDGEAAEEAEADEAPAPDFRQTQHRVKVGGEEAEVSYDELVSGYQRQADYTRKTQALADEVKSVRAVRDEYAANLTKLQTALNSLQEQAPDWDKLRAELPKGEFADRYADWQRKQDALRTVQAEAARVQQEQAAEQARLRDEAIQREHQELLRAFPEWKDPKVAQEHSQKIVQAAVALGFSEEDVAQVADHRLVKLLWKAAQYDAVQSKAGTLPGKAKAVAPAKPGAKPPQSAKGKQAAHTRAARERLRETGRVDDAVGLIQDILG